MLAGVLASEVMVGGAVLTATRQSPEGGHGSRHGLPVRRWRGTPGTPSGGRASAAVSSRSAGTGTDMGGIDVTRKGKIAEAGSRPGSRREQDWQGCRPHDGEPEPVRWSDTVLWGLHAGSRHDGITATPEASPRFLGWSHWSTWEGTMFPPSVDPAPRRTGLSAAPSSARRQVRPPPSYAQRTKRLTR